eukprot:TRINITY_DN7342_c2_g1_i2.p2 TRINITY_DN7342_c2_g1~~TRINITY_DN7342_c2_g1_i2.p2  ORF type:complete len:203 (+),score=32.33 TRINITY_DN7342_c2_g1_i2:1102-1710(+)
MAVPMWATVRVLNTPLLSWHTTTPASSSSSSPAGFLQRLVPSRFRAAQPEHSSRPQIVEQQEARHKQLEHWLAYWIAFHIVFLFHRHASLWFSWVPFWYHALLGTCIWLQLPYFNGAMFLYRFCGSLLVRLLTAPPRTQRTPSPAPGQEPLASPSVPESPEVLTDGTVEEDEEVSGKEGSDEPTKDEWEDTARAPTPPNKCF